ncbi:hypothetical protein [Agaribacterium haliotis]|uniref:hypothetical protein n=1 Tax=Agaribacterium haliotis TaxID=2013869 RepID=UPI000BB59A45|nr:hypothetical protein [Agaribacterium haliotis]
MKTKTSIKLSLAISAICSSGAFAQSIHDSTSDFNTDKQRSHVWNEALEPLELVNGILCFTEQMRVTDFVNDGAYIVLADEDRCFSNDSNGSDSEGGGSPAYKEVIVEATRESDTSPLIVSAWMPDMGDDDFAQAIKFKAVIYEGASDSNPFGQFTFNFDFYNSFSDSSRRGGGELKTVDIEEHIGFTLYEQDQRGSHRSSQSASVVMSADRSEGFALTAVEWGDFGRANALAFNDNHVLIQAGDNYDSLAFQNGDNEGMCLSRTEFIDSVHRYDLYHATTGARVEVNSGFSFRYDSDGNGAADSHGHVGYWGVWTEDENGLPSGSEITKENFGQGGTPESFRIVSAPGKLIKKSVEALPLSNAAGIDFRSWDGAYELGYDNLIVNYSSNGFYVVAGLRHGENGEEIVQLDPMPITLESYETLYMYSEQLGGEVRYQSGSDFLSFYREEVLNGSGDLFANGDLELHCFDRCPIGTLDAGDLADYDSPYSLQGESAVTYSFGNSGANALTLVRNDNGEPVKFADGISESTLNNSAHQWGVSSGILVDAATAASLQNSWDVYEPTLVSTFYVWETGAHNWNKLSAVKDENGNMLAFDKPIQVRYTHSDANDRSGDAGDFNGQVFMLNYGGNGDFWGIPHSRENDRHQALFSIADGASVGANNEYVIKARDIEQRMAPANGQCGSMRIREPAAPVPTRTEGSADIGAMPQVSGGAKVIAGEIQGANE